MGAMTTPTDKELDEIECDCRRFVGFVRAADAIAALRLKLAERSVTVTSDEP
jgi:hypothetical protein